MSKDDVFYRHDDTDSHFLYEHSTGNGRMYVSVAADKGTAGERPALLAIRDLEEKLRTQGVPVETYQRKDVKDVKIRHVDCLIVEYDHKLIVDVALGLTRVQ